MRIRRGLASRRLPCGCVTGVYETYREEIVTIIDAHGAFCADPAHHPGNVLPGSAGQPLQPEAHETSRR
jgi:hypothetical protein